MIRSSVFLFALSFGPYLTATLDAAEPRAPVGSLSERFASAAASDAETPNFQRHVVPLLGRLGCNGRSCHGSFQGRGGFRLSMFGYDFDLDHKALLAGDPARVNTAEPSKSQILLKPTSDDDHGGGKRFEIGGWEDRVLRAWIKAGAPQNSRAASNLIRLEVTPRELNFENLDQRAKLRALAHWSDGTVEDVTCLTRFSTNDEVVAKVTPNGEIKASGSGATCIICCYDRDVVSVAITLPVSEQSGERYPSVPTPTRVDELVVAKLRKLGIVPSPVIDDATFLRRVSLDITGTLPVPDEVRSFSADNSSDKRARKIDELLERPAYAVLWAGKLCDITGLNAPLQLGATEFARVAGDQWQAWMERKVRENVPYDQIVEGLVLAVSRRPGESYEEFSLRMSGYVRTKEPQDFTAEPQMPWYWYRANLGMPEEKALGFAYSFLGVRLDCAQCHKHPFDVWTQQDFQQFTGCFERIRSGISPANEAAQKKLIEELGIVKGTTAAERRGKYKKVSEAGERAPWGEVYIAPQADAPGTGRPTNKPKEFAHLTPKILGGPELKDAVLGNRKIDREATDDPRVPLMTWLRDKNNPYFARAWVNRVWAMYFGRGIVDPPDDLNLANPPSNKELLDELARDFIASGFDMKRLHRTIAGSRTYQLSRETNATNREDERNFSHFLVRRLPAEVAVDALLQATGDQKRLDAVGSDVRNRRIGMQPTADLSRTEYSLAVFGKPLRLVNCDCEREAEPSLLQSIFLRNDADTLTALNRNDGWLKSLAKAPAATAAPSATRPPEVLIREAYLRTLNREPRTHERTRALAHIRAAATPLEGLNDVLWALLNTQEFITNH
ncbi:MAG: DUF1549 and DUF1553 domain-containing protein [Planctomycetia bacterium]|nr:DUF1549 and DUF1553 domain-containing protein [Planctomycetia bacterium]